ncbi:MAG: zinc-dependent metalloprotease [Actinomycetota bacterium]
MTDPFDLPPDVLRRVPLFAELQKVLSWSGGPVNWDLTRQLAVSDAAGEVRAQPVEPDDHREVAEHVRLAELWLEEVGLPAPTHLVTMRAGTAVDWAEHAVNAYRELIDPIAAKASKALSDGTAQEGVEAMLSGAVGQIAPLFMGIQSGTTIGMVAREVTGAADVALPAAEGELLIVVPAVDEVARAYTLDRRAARQWVALREASRRMTLDGYGEVRAQFFARYLDYVSSLDIDLSRGLQRLQEIDVSDPERLQEALADEGLFSPEPSAETAAAAERLGAFLSIIEAFASAAVDSAAERAGGMAPVAEAFRRTAATERRGITMLHRFIGLEPPAPAAARTFVREVVARGGWDLAGRAFDGGSVPTNAELDDPQSWIRRIDG